MSFHTARGGRRLTLPAALALVVMIGALAAATAGPGGGRPQPIYPPHVPGEILIKFRNTAGPSERANARALVGGLGIGKFRSGAERWKTGPSVTTEEAIARLHGNPHVEYVEPNYIVTADAVPNDPFYPLLWGLHNAGDLGGVAGADIDAEAAWEATTGSRAVLVGIIDTGIDYTHPDLVANIWTNPGEIPGNHIDDDHNGYVDDIHGWDFVNHDNDPFDDHYHGTHVAGTIGGVGNNGVGVVGVNWQVSLVALKFLDSSGSGNTADAVSAVEYATMMHLDMTNNSWGGGGYSQTLYDAIAAAGAANVLFVAAAGNSSRDTDVSPSYPAAYDLANIVSVAATNRADALASFSNYGATTVDLGAPGVDIYSAAPSSSYQYLSGTSMAAPHVTGVAALLRAASPGLAVPALKRALLDSADPVPALAGKTVSGGRLNAVRALASLDHVPPDAIVDLGLSSPTSSTVTLSWTATGDDGAIGTAAAYDVRYSTAPIDEAGFTAAPRASGAPSPRASGSAETMEVWGLTPGTTWYFAIKAIDDGGNRGPISNVVSGTTLPAPTFASTPSAFALTLSTGQTATRTLSIANAGAGTLDWSIPAPTVSGSLTAQQAALTLAKGETDPRAGSAAGSVTRGPDAFGYRYSDSDEPGGPVFSWYDLAPSGAPVPGLDGDDQISGPIDLGFDFPFYGSVFSAVRVSTNGFLTFTGSNADYTNQPLPCAAAPGDLIAPFWDDLDFSSGGRAYIARAAGSFTVQFVNVRPYNGAGSYDFEVVLRDSGEILYQYRSMTGPVDGATVGIQDGSRTNDLQAAFNRGYVHDSLAVRFGATPQWLSASPARGRLAAGEHQDVDLSIDAAGLHGGVHAGAVVVDTNDPLNPSVSHPVTLTVVDAPTISVAPASLDFGAVFVGFGSSRLLTVSNTGTIDLHADLTATDPAVALSAGTVVVAPGRSVQVGVTLTARALGVVATSITIQSDAPNNPSLDVPITASVEPLPGIAADPPSFSEHLLTGATVTRNLRLTNTGGSDLALNVTAELWPAPGSSATAQTVPMPAVVNGGFEEGSLHGWVAASNGRSELIPWSVTVAGSDYFGASSPSEGRFYALNGFDGGAGLVYDLYQDIDVPRGTVQADLLFDDRIQYDSLGIGSSLPRIYEATLEDPNGALLATIVHEEIRLNGRPYTDTGWRHRSVSIAPWAGQMVRIHIRESIPETYTGPASIEFDGFRIEAQMLPEWLSVSPAAATIPPGGSQDFSVLFDAGGSGTIVYSGALRLETNIPGTPTVRVPALLSVTGAPDIFVSGETVRVESVRSYTGSGSATAHALAVPSPPAAGGAITLIADGDYGYPYETATATAEGVTIGTVGGQSYVDCTPASGTFAVSAGVLAALAADGVVNVVVQNTPDVNDFCSTNQHTVRLEYPGPADHLDYGSFFVGESRARSVVITNRGNDLLQVSSIATDRPEFAPSIASLLLDPGSSAPLTVTFTPSSAAVFDGTLTILSNDGDTPILRIPLAGEGLEPPAASVSPASLTSTLFSGSQETQHLTLSNGGGSALVFRISALPTATSGTIVTSPFTGFPAAAPGASDNPAPTPHAGDPPAPAPGDESYSGVPGQFEILASSPVPLTCLAEDRNAAVLYAQQDEGTGFFRYSAGSNRWEPLASAPINSGNNGGAALLNGKIYTVYTGDGGVMGVYDIASGSWSTTVNPLRAGTANIASDGSRFLYLVVNDYFVRYEPATGTATPLAPPPFWFEEWGGMGILDGVLYAHQGNGTQGFASYDIAADRWTRLPSLPSGAVLGATLDPFKREYYAYGNYDGTNLYTYSIDSGLWRISTIPFFAVNDGGLGWLPFPVAGVYFLQGQSGTGLARLITGAGFLSFDPISGSVPPHSSIDIDVLFDARARLGGTYTADVVVSSNDPINPEITVPAALRVIGVPDMVIRGNPTTVESTRPYTTSGARTSHVLAISDPPAGGGTLTLVADGDYGFPGETATATAEGVGLGTVGGSSGLDCTPASGTFPLSAATLAALAADGVVQVDVQNSSIVDVFCSANRHTVRLDYYGPSDRLEFGSMFVGASRSLGFLISNVGTDTLHLSSIASSDPAFTPSAAGGDVAPGSTLAIAVVFRPGSATAFAGELTLTSNDPDQPLVRIALSGTGLLPPVIGVQPASMDARLPAGGTESRTLEISNTGLSPLVWSLSLGPASAGAVTVPFAGLRPEVPGASGNPDRTPDPTGAPAPAPGDGSYLGMPGDFERLASSAMPLTCVAQDKDTGIIYAQGNASTSFYRYKADTNVWETLPPSPIYSGNNGGAALLNGKVYTTYTGNSGSAGVYDISSNTWTTITHPLRAGTGNIASDGSRYLYLIVGYSFVRYEPATFTTTALAPPPFYFEPWGGLRYLDGVIYGHQGNGAQGFASYDTATDAWTPLPSVPGGAVLGAAIDPIARQYYAYGSYGGSSLYRYSIDTRAWSVSTVPFFALNDGGMAWLPFPTPGIYFVQGESGIGFARLITDFGFLRFGPVSGAVDPGSSATIDLVFDATYLTGGTFAATLKVSSNDPVNPRVDVPMSLTVFDVPNMVIEAEPVTLQSSRIYSTAGATTSHMLRMPCVPDGDGTLQLAAAGNYESAASSATVYAEGSTIGAAGGTGVVCGQAVASFTIPRAALVAMDADGIAGFEVRNTASVGVSCAQNAHTLTLSYPVAADHLDFGPQVAGTSRSVGLRITNRGTGVLHITSIASSDPAFTPSTSFLNIPRSATQTLIVTFAPPSAGARSGVLSLESDDYRSPHLEIPLSGMAAGPPVIGVQPASLESALFPEMTEEQILTLTNAGTGPLHVVVNSTTAGNAPFLSVSPVTGAVDPGGFLNIAVRFDARLLPIGAHAGTVEIDSDDPATPRTTVPVSLHVIGRPALSLTAGAITLESLKLYKPSSTRTTHSLPIASPPGGNGTLELVAEGNFQGTTRTATASIEGTAIGSVGNTFATCGTASGIFPVPLSELSAFAADGVVQVDVQNSPGVANVCTLGQHTVRLRYHLPLSVLDFGTTFLGTTSSRSFFVENTGTDDLIVSAITSDSPWVSVSPAGATLAPGASGAFTATFTAGVEGGLAGFLTFASNDTLHPSLTIPVTALAARPPIVGVDPASLASTQLPGGLETQRLTLTNTGFSPLQFTLSVASSSFTFLSATPATGVVPPGGSLDVTIGFDARLLQIGNYSGSVLVASNDPVTPLVTVPATLHVAGRPAIGLSTGTTTVESSASFHLTGGFTSHTLALSEPPGGTGTFEVIVDGDFQGIGHIATASIEGVAIGSVGGSPAACGRASRSFVIPQGQLAGFASDGVLRAEVQNAPLVSTICTTSAHTVRLSYHHPLSGLDFGPVALGAVSSRTFFVENLGTDVLTVRSIASDSASYTLTPAEMILASGAAAPVVATFAPDSEGAHPGVISFSSDDPVHPLIELAVSGEGRRPPIIGVTPASLGSTLRPPSQETRTLTLANTGSLPLTFSVAVPPASFVTVTPVAGTVPPSATVDLSVLFDTGMLLPGAHAATIEIASNDPATPSLAVPAGLYVLGEPAISVQGPAITVESVKPYTTAGARTLHRITFLHPPASGADVALVAEGDFGDANETATATVELARTFSVGGAGGGCASAGGGIALSRDEMAVYMADGALSLRVQNSADVDASCPVNRHTVRVTYKPVADLIDFGTVFTGAAAIRTLVIENQGTDTLNITAITSDQPGFTATPAAFALPPDGVQTVTLRLAAPGVGDFEGSLVIASDDPAAPETFLGLVVTGVPAPILSVSPAALAASLVTGRTGTQTLTLANPGGSDLDFATTVRFDGPGSFLTITPDSGAVVPGGSVALAARFDTAGLGLGIHTAAIDIVSNDPLAAAVTVPVTLTVIGVPDIAVSGDAITLESTLPYGTAGAQTFHHLVLAGPPAGGASVRLIAEGDYRDASATATATLEGAPLGSVGGAGSDCATLEEIFSVGAADFAAAAADGAIDVTVRNAPTVGVSCPSNRHTVALTYRPRADTLVFGEVFPGWRTTRTLLVENRGGADLNITSIAADRPEFTIDPGTLVIPPGGSSVLTIAMLPGGLGPVHGTLTILSDDPDTPSIAVALAASVVNPPIAGLAPAALTAALPPGGAATRALRISNTGDSDLVWSLGGPGAGAPAPLPSWVSAAPIHGTIPPGAWTDVTLALDGAPLADGDHIQTLCVYSNDPATPRLDAGLLVHVGEIAPDYLSVEPATLNLASNGLTIRASIQLPAALDPRAIVVPGILLNGALAPIPGMTSFADENGDGVLETILKFDRAGFEAIVPEGQSVPVTLTGEVKDRTWFRGTTTIRAIRPQLTAPNGGDYLLIGQPVTIAWNAAPAAGGIAYTVILSRDAGVIWETLATGLTGLSYVWTPSGAATSLARIRILAADSKGVMGYDTSDADFTIAGSLAPPHGVQTLQVGRDAGGAILLTWVRPAVDATHGPADHYRVMRSVSAAGGFVEAGAPANESFAEPAGNDGGIIYYMIVAVNAAGESTD